MNNTQMTLALLTEPRAAFNALRERPTFWFPLLLLAFGTASAVVAYFSLVDVAWLNDHIASGDARMEKMQADGSMPQMSRSLLMWTSLTAVVVGIPVVRLLEGAYYFLAGRVTNIVQSFRHWMALACWSSLPLALALVVSVTVLALHPTGQATQEQLNLLSLNELFFHVGEKSPWYSLASNLTLLHPWAWGLAATGVRVWSGRSWPASIAFALMPWVVFYGVWALFASL